ncbi:MAG: hypothetical protein ABGY95_02070 [Rubritalea sp.]
MHAPRLRALTFFSVHKWMSRKENTEDKQLPAFIGTQSLTD